ncbi:MAG: translation initiation factor IF-3 [bacterium]|nr:translation initiation factor IF-3 [bacterium]
MIPRVRINRNIRALELRVINNDGANLGVMATAEALKLAEGVGLDLIEISPNATPPIAKIAEYGKFQYELNKKQKEVKSKVKTVEVKTVQVKIGTGEHDLELKAKKTSEWLNEGHRVKIDLFLPGRSKYLEQKFLRERLDRLLKLLTVSYKIAEEARKSPKGLSLLIEKGKS